MSAPESPDDEDMTRRMISDAAARVFSGNVSRTVLLEAESGAWSGTLWQFAQEAGFQVALLSEHGGGIGASWHQAAPIARSCGYWHVPLPVTEHLLGAALLEASGIPPPEGVITLMGSWQDDALEIAGPDEKVALNGIFRGVPHARNADWGVSCARENTDETPNPARFAYRVVLLDLRSSGTTIRQGRNMAGEPRDDVELRGVDPTAMAPLGGLHPHNPAVVLGALARAEQAAGAVHRTLEHCLAYVGERAQFGRQLSGFQVIQHHLAVAAGEVAAASMAVDATSVRCVAGGCADVLGRPFDVAVAKIRTGQAASRLAAVAHQVHGAMGFTYEHTLHLATRRLWSWRNEFGSGSQWAAWLGSEVIQRGKEHLWPAITNQSVDR